MLHESCPAELKRREQVTEDAKFLHLDSRILALEQNASGGVEGVESDIEVPCLFYTYRLVSQIEELIRFELNPPRLTERSWVVEWRGVRRLLRGGC
jgi:hypothetical protein